MGFIAGKPPVHQPSFKPSDYDCLNIKLKTYYARKRKLYEDAYPDLYDKDLQRLFPAGGGATAALKASHYLRTHRRQIMNAVCAWTNEKKYRVNQLLGKLVQLCDQLDLRAQTEDSVLPLQIASFITTLIMNHLFTGRFKRNK